ncbi:Paf1 complex protein [Planoprotostelium fungivorum]|uniref:Paf1 complex protein n=1 Tax=Planoprotostelium fungivorum TaxID=1890364 RepID=A0A2P6N7B3_9EUKA|nr:Paf1 complex protein [Planoprotostelium fungivorum]PRP82541.1 Paf1 complex protein [Planoprotostelium fungivorum]
MSQNGTTPVTAKNTAIPGAAPTPGKSEFICKLKYHNRIPDVPFEPKLLVYPFDPQRFVKYIPNSLERTQKWALHTEPSLALPIRLVDPNYQRTIEGGGVTDPNDLALMQPLDSVEEACGGVSKTTSKKKERPAVFWSQRTRYMAGHYDGPQIKSMSIETRCVCVGIVGKKRDEKIRSIDMTFEAARGTPKHHRNAELTVAKITPVLPDFDRWGNEYNQVVFESDPINASTHQDWSLDRRAFSKAESIIKGFHTSDEERRNVVAYLVPKNTTLANREREEMEEKDEVEYEWVREYTYEHAPKESFQGTYCFSVGNDAVTYNPLVNRFSFLKFKDATGQFIQPVKVTSQKRKMTDEEAKVWTKRKKSIVPEDYNI